MLKQTSLNSSVLYISVFQDWPDRGHKEWTFNQHKIINIYFSEMELQIRVYNSIVECFGCLKNSVNFIYMITTLLPKNLKFFQGINKCNHCNVSRSAMLAKVRFTSK